MGRGVCPALGFHCVGCLRRGAGWWSLVGSTGGPNTDGLGPGGVQRSPILFSSTNRGLVLCVSAKTAQLCSVQDSVGPGESLCPVGGGLSY